MPYARPGSVKYVTNGSGGTYTHLQPVKESNYVGVAIKQVAPAATAALSSWQSIAIGEAYILLVKGEVQTPVSSISTPAKGDAVYIDSSNALTKTSGGNTKFGRISEIAGGRGCPTGYVRIDLDAKDSF